MTISDWILDKRTPVCLNGGVSPEGPGGKGTEMDTKIDRGSYRTRSDAAFYLVRAVTS